MNLPDDNRLLKAPAGGPRLLQRRSLQEANEVSLQLSGNHLHDSSDPRGQRLRALRQAQGLNPSEVATEACISLGQLYELETGGERLFYSPTLRQQAGRRVAQLLGVDWDRLDNDGAADEMHSGPATTLQGSSSTTQGQAMAANPPQPGSEGPSGDAAVTPAAVQAESSVEPAHTQARDDGTQTPPAQAQGLRGLFWALVLVALALMAARMGWIPGVRLPLA